MYLFLSFFGCGESLQEMEERRYVVASEMVRLQEETWTEYHKDIVEPINEEKRARQRAAADATEDGWMDMSNLILPPGLTDEPENLKANCLLVGSGESLPMMATGRDWLRETANSARCREIYKLSVEKAVIDAEIYRKAMQ